MEGIAADPKAGAEEKKGMMEMLRRFEAAQVDGEDVLAELEESDGEEELRAKLDGVDLGQSSALSAHRLESWFHLPRPKLMIRLTGRRYRLKRPLPAPAPGAPRSVPRRYPGSRIGCGEGTARVGC